MSDHSVVPGGRILPVHLNGVEITAERVLFIKSFPDPNHFNDFNALSPELIDYCAERCRLIGLDTPSVDPYSSNRVSQRHLQARYGGAGGSGTDGCRGWSLHADCLAFKIQGSDASPIRAVLVEWYSFRIGWFVVINKREIWIKHATISNYRCWDYTHSLALTPQCNPYLTDFDWNLDQDTLEQEIHRLVDHNTLELFQPHDVEPLHCTTIFADCILTQSVLRTETKRR